MNSEIVVDRPVCERWSHLFAQQIDWHYANPYHDRLFDAQGFRLDQWRRSGQAMLVKSGAGRTIYRVRIPGGDFYVKHFRANNFTSLIHQFFREARAKKEFELAHFLRGKNVATFNPIALGQRRRHGLLLESYLVTESISGGMTIFDLIDRCVMTGQIELPPHQRFEIARGLGKLAAEIHSAGVEHRDLHERNIIARANPDGSLKFFMLDLHELRLRRQSDWSWSRRDLSRMGRYFTMRTSATDRRRFFRAYSQHRQLNPADESALVREMEASVVDSRADFWRRRDARGIHKYTRIHEYRGKNVFAQALPEIPESMVRTLMDRPELPFEINVAKWCKKGRATRVAEVNLPQLRRDTPLVYKQYYFKGWHESLATVVRPNQATRAWSNGGAFLLRELPTPRPLVLIHQTRFGLPTSSFILWERVPSALELRDYLEQNLAAAPNSASARQIVAGLIAESAKLLHTLHERGISHRDLKASNILASATSDPARPKLTIIDLDGVTTWRKVPAAHRIQNLARLNVSFWTSNAITRGDRLRFLRQYLGRPSRNREFWKRYWRLIARDSVAKIRKNLRRGRVVL